MSQTGLSTRSTPSAGVGTQLARPLLLGTGAAREDCVGCGTLEPVREAESEACCGGGGGQGTASLGDKQVGTGAQRWERTPSLWEKGDIWLWLE